MNTTKIIITVIIVAVVGILAGVGFKAMSNKNTTTSGSNTTKNSAASNVDLSYSGDTFAWGITALTFPFPTYMPSFTPVQMAEAKKLGVDYVRIDYLPSNPVAAQKAVDAAVDQGIKVVLIIPFGPKDIFSDKNLKTDATNYVNDIVKMFKGKVAVYQLATEVSSVALGNNGAVHGIELKDYPADKLAAVTTWVMTANDAVKKADPSAKTLVNDQWVHTAFFDNYFAKGGNFDILGWNWFSDMGTTMDTVTIDASKHQTYQLMNKLKGYNKPIWLTEVSRRLGSQGKNEKAQSDFITTMANYVKTQPAIKGFFVYNLLEDQAAPTQERGYSLIIATDNGKQQTVTGHKPAFDTFQKIIQSK